MLARRARRFQSAASHTYHRSMLGVLTWCLKIGLAALLAAPLFVLLCAALFAPGEVPHAGQWWPQNPSVDALKRAWTLADMGTALGWSMLIASLGMLLSVAIASLSALAIHLSPAVWRRALITALVFAASIPYTVLWLPRFLLFNAVGLQDTPIPLLAPALLGGGPLLILLYLYSLRRIPAIQFEAARLEGLGMLSMWWTVALPQLRGASLAVAFLSFAAFWGEALDPLIYLRSGAITTAPLALHGLEILGQGELSVWMAGAVWLILPIMFLLMAMLPWLKAQETH